MELSRSTRSTRGHRLYLLASLAAMAAVLAAVAWGGWQYVGAVPTYRPILPPPPEPNGYDRAVAAVRRRRERGLPRVASPLDGRVPAELQAQVALWHDLLAEVRATFAMEWSCLLLLQSPLNKDNFAGLSDLRTCGHLFAAEALAARQGGDPSLALARSLDAMEMASKVSQGGGVAARLTANAIHLAGLREAERVALSVPASAIPAALERVRRVRRNWPSVAEMWENERISLLSIVTQFMRETRQHSLVGQLVLFHQLQTQPTVPETARIALIPRRQSIAAIDSFFRQRITEGRKPFPRRRPVVVPDDPWCGVFVVSYSDENIWRYETSLSGLALLEAALAVRMHRLTRGRHPDSLSEIDRRWLPAIPRDQWDQPVIGRTHSGRPILYSLGPDGGDDGGRAIDTAQIGPTSVGDLVFGRLVPRSRPGPPTAR